MKTFCFLLIALMASIFWGMYLSATYKYEHALNNRENNVAYIATEEVFTPKPVSTTTTKATSSYPIITKSKCGSGSPCVAADIAPHNTREDCWVYLSPINKVYNVTEYVSNPKEHPGGDIIVPYCGTNIYNVFIKKDGGHAHSDKALETVLQTYYLAPFQS